MKKGKNKIVVAIVILLILGISVGYAALGDTFKIKGTTNITGNTWSISFRNIQEDPSNNVTASTQPHIVTGSSSDTYTQQVEYEVTLTKPQDVYIFTVDLYNGGSVDAEISNVQISGLTADAANYIDYTVTDITDPTNPKNAEAGDVIGNSGGIRTYEVVTEYLDVDNATLSQYAGSNVTLTLTFQVDLIQHTS